MNSLEICRKLDRMCAILRSSFKPTDMLFRLFLAAQRTASLRHDDETQASLINRLLRSYLHYSLYDQADKLISKTNFPTSAPNSQYARYHYYLGRIKAV